jgi:ribosomal protein L19
VSSHCQHPAAALMRRDHGARQLAAKDAPSAVSFACVPHLLLQVQEAKSSRVQRVDGTVIAMAGSGSTKTFVVRRIFQVSGRSRG